VSAGTHDSLYKNSFWFLVFSFWFTLCPPRFSFYLPFREASLSCFVVSAGTHGSLYEAFSF